MGQLRGRAKRLRQKKLNEAKNEVEARILEKQLVYQQSKMTIPEKLMKAVSNRLIRYFRDGDELDGRVLQAIGQIMPQIQSFYQNGQGIPVTGPKSNALLLADVEWQCMVEYRGKHAALRDWILTCNGIVANGSRGTGKTQCIADTNSELLMRDFVQDFHLYSGKEKSASKNLKLMKACLIHNGVGKFRKDNGEMLELPNGNTVQAHANTIADINECRGLPGRKQAIWIDEANQMELDSYENLFGFTSGMEGWFLELSGNLLGGDQESKSAAFSNICTSEVRDQLMDDSNMAYFEFEDVDIWWTSGEAKALTKRWLETVGGEDAVTRQLTLLKVSKTGKLYNMDDVDKIFLPIQSKASECQSIVMTVDWGAVHDTAILVTGIKDGLMVELFAWHEPFKNVKREHLTNVFRTIKMKFNPERVIAERSANEYIGIEELQATFQRVDRVMWAAGENDYWSKKQCAAAGQIIVKERRAIMHDVKLKTQMKEMMIKYLSKQTICPVGDDMHDVWMYACRVHIDKLGLLKAKKIEVTMMGSRR